jgi:hypothetical protein
VHVITDTILTNYEFYHTVYLLVPCSAWFSPYVLNVCLHKLNRTELITITKYVLCDLRKNSNISFLKQQVIVTHQRTVLRERENKLDKSLTYHHLGMLCFYKSVASRIGYFLWAQHFDSRCVCNPTVLVVWTSQSGELCE